MREMMGSAGTASARLLERERELEAIEAAFESARGGSGRLLLLEGSAGIGKSRLLTEAARLAEDLGLEILRARGSELESTISFGVVRQLFEAALARADPAERESLLSGSAGSAVEVLDRDKPESSGASLIHSLFWLLSNIAHRRPVALLIDDLQWVDASSWGFLRYVANRVEAESVCLILARRDPSGRPEGEPVGDLLAHPTAALLAPSPLSTEAVSAIVNERLGESDPAFDAAFADATGGNPLLVNELAEELRSNGVSPTAAEADRVASRVPPSVAKITIARVRRQGEEALALARALAVFAEDASVRHAAALAGLDSKRAAEQIDALLEIEVLAGNGGIAFAHPLIRSAVYDNIPDGTRGQLHRQAAELLVAEGASPERVAAHLLCAPAAGDPQFLDVLFRAAENAIARAAPESAVRYLERALEKAGGEERGRALFMLGQVEASIGAPAAVEHMRGALELADAVEARAEILMALGRFSYTAADFAAAREAFAEIVQILDEEHLLHAEARAQLAGVDLIGFSQGRSAEALQELLRAVGDEPTPGQRSALAHASLGASIGMLISREETVDLCKRAIGEGELLAHETSEGLAIYSVTGALMFCEEYALHRGFVDTVLADAQERRSVLGFASASYVRSGSRGSSGDVAGALDDVEAALAAGTIGWDAYRQAALHALALWRIERDDLDGAEAALDFDFEEVQSIARPMLHNSRGLLRLEQRRWEDAAADLQLAGELELGPRFIGPYPWRPSLALALAHLGRTAEAHEQCDTELGLARRWGAPRWVALAMHGKAVISPLEERLEMLHEAVDTARRSEGRLDEARIRLDLGRALHRARAKKEARRTLETTLEQARACGALRIERLAEEELALAGGRPRRKAFTGVDSLTPSERRVASLAAEGLTNREIAERLFISAKAVEWHLSNSYRKLEISSRKDLPGLFTD